jgi:hypothetical protein
MAALIYVTGVPGTGKSTIRRELRLRGEAAFGTDEDGICAFFDASGCAVPPDAVVDSSAWRAAHSWRIIPNLLDQLVASTDVSRVFLCGSAANEADVWERFSAVIALVVDEATVHFRLDERADNNFGKSPAERAKVVGWLGGFEETFRSLGAIIVDATEPIDRVAAAILTATAHLER